MQKPNKTRIYLIGTIAILIVGLFLGGFFPRLTQWNKIKKEANREKLPSVSIMKAISDKKPIELVLPSTTDAIRSTPIWARTNGYLSKFLVDIGDVVEEGQLLAEIDTPEIDQELRKAKADLASAVSKLEIARITAKRCEALYKRNQQAIPLQDVDKCAFALSSAESEVVSFKANVQRLENIQGFNKIYAPFSGTIVERNIDLGSLFLREAMEILSSFSALPK